MYESVCNPNSRLLHFRGFICLEENLKTPPSTLLSFPIKRIPVLWLALGVCLFSKCFVLTHLE